MKETQRFLKKQRQSYRSGFISTWYLCIFLYAAGLISVMMLNDQKRLMIMHNLIMAQEYLNQETEVIHDIRCMIADGSLNEGTHETARTRYTVTVAGPLIQVTVLYPRSEIITLTSDGEEFIHDITTAREEPDVYGLNGF